MEIFLDCLPCMLKQALEAARMVTAKEELHDAIISDAICELTKYHNYPSAPALAEVIHSLVKKHTASLDPYAKIKSRDISKALSFEPKLLEFVNNSNDCIKKALKVSATGNIMDSAMNNTLDIEQCLECELAKPFAVFDIELFSEDFKIADNILIIGDNAGEVVFDTVLAKTLSKNCKVYYAVRERAIINDATISDAKKTNIGNYAKIISTGCGMPGAVLDACSDSFIDIFNKADIVISKGQGNFEALSDTKRAIYFLLKAKCNRIATLLNTEINSYIFKKFNLRLK